MNTLLKFLLILAQILFAFHVIFVQDVIKAQLIFPLEENYYIQGKDASFDYDELLAIVDYLEPPDVCEEPADGEAHCVWYGKCEVPSGDGGTKTVPCHDKCKGRYVVSTDNPDLPNLKYTLLNQFCPDFLEPVNGEPYPRVCCSLRTLLLLNVELSSYQGLLNRCPSCWENYRKFYCTLNCSPYQSDHMVVTNTTPATYKPLNIPTPSTIETTTLPTIATTTPSTIETTTVPV